MSIFNLAQKKITKRERLLISIVMFLFVLHIITSTIIRHKHKKY